MPLLKREGVALYFEVVGNGTPLIMLHGFMGTLEENRRWIPLLPGYQLILIDARGHGRSGKPHEPSAYCLAERTRDIIAVLDHLNIAKAHYIGYSMGGWLGMGLAVAYPERFFSIVVGGIGPQALSPESSRFWRDPMIAAMQSGMERFCQLVEAAEQREMSLAERARYLAQDHLALIAQLSYEEEPYFEKSLSSTDVNLLLYVGDQDMHHESAMALSTRLQNVHFLSLAGCEHNSASQPNAFLADNINRFLAANEQP